MTTPRVTVPVEMVATPAIRDALGLFCSVIVRAEQWSDTCKAAYLAALKELDRFAMLSAAPAPEGGAMRYRHKKRGTEYTLIGVGRAQGELQDDDPVVLYRGDDGGLWVRHQVEFCDGRFEEIPALATREEAPAEVGELVGLIDYLENMRAETVTDEGREIMSEWINALRAQPPAREDAQPVAWMRLLAGQVTDLTCIEREGYLPLYFHPAPDALRVAVPDRWLEAARYATERGLLDYDRNIRRAEFQRIVTPEALADLQAEQGVK